MPRIFVEVEVTATGPYCSIHQGVTCPYFDAYDTCCTLFRDEVGNPTVLALQTITGFYLRCAACVNASEDPRQPGDEVQDPYFDGTPGGEYHTGHPTNLHLPNDRETLEAWARLEMKNARPEVEAEPDTTPRLTAWERLNKDELE
jgi:hypothetical protein